MKSQLEVRKLNYQLETVFLLQVDSFCELGGRFPMLATQTRDKKNGCRGAGIFRLVTHSPVSAITALAAVNLPQPACHSRALTFSHLTLGHDPVSSVEDFLL